MPKHYTYYLGEYILIYSPDHTQFPTFINDSLNDSFLGEQTGIRAFVHQILHVAPALTPYIEYFFPFESSYIRQILW